MQYVAMVECLGLVRTLATKIGAAAVEAMATTAASAASASAVAGRSAVKAMEELAHALGALEALLAEGAGDTSASGEKESTL